MLDFFENTCVTNYAPVHDSESIFDAFSNQEGSGY